MFEAATSLWAFVEWKEGGSIWLNVADIVCMVLLMVSDYLEEVFSDNVWLLSIISGTSLLLTANFYG